MYKDPLGGKFMVDFFIMLAILQRFHEKVLLNFNVSGAKYMFLQSN